MIEVHWAVVLGVGLWAIVATLLYLDERQDVRQFRAVLRRHGLLPDIAKDTEAARVDAGLSVILGGGK